MLPPYTQPLRDVWSLLGTITDCPGLLAIGGFQEYRTVHTKIDEASSRHIRMIGHPPAKAVGGVGGVGGVL
jgi:hypothetical protein